MDKVQRVLGSEIGFPVLTLISCASSLTVMGLANYAREAAPAWHGPMSLFLLMMSGLALRDLIRARRTRRTSEVRVAQQHPAKGGR
jgi:hypothetical protein